MNTHVSPETIYNEFMSRRKLMEQVRQYTEPDEYKRGMASLYIEYMEAMGEDLFEMFLDGERMAQPYGF